MTARGARAALWIALTVVAGACGGDAPAFDAGVADAGVPDAGRVDAGRCLPIGARCGPASGSDLPCCDIGCLGETEETMICQ